MGVRTLRMTAALAGTLAALAFCLPTAEAAVVGVNVTPAKTAVAAKGPAAVSVNWQIERAVVDVPNPGTLSSPNLQISIGGAVAATLPRSLTANAAGTTNAETVRIREVVQIPGTLIYRAIKERSTLTIRREFSDNDGYTSEDAQFEVRPSGDGFAALRIQRLELAFDDDARSKVLSKGSELRAVAEINTSGIGLLTGQWEVATGSTTAGVPVFRALSRVRQGVAAGGRTVITSPALPTNEEGTSLVRFRITDPDLAFETPVLQYYVTPSAMAAAPASQQRVLVAAPRPGAQLTADTRFAWAAVPGAEAYQIAFYKTAAGPAEPLDPANTLQNQSKPEIPDGAAPVAGVFVAGAETEVVLQAFTLAQLPAGRSYLWQVTAIGANGAKIGSSTIQEIYKP